MELSPREFYEMTIEDFILKAEGFRNARVREERIYRRLAEFTIAPHLEKGSPSIMSMWPITDDEKLKELQAARKRGKARPLNDRQKEWLRKAAENRDKNINPQFN